jgi:hypothetical protein
MMLLTLRGEFESAAAQMQVWLADQQTTHRQIVMNALLAVNRHLAGDNAATETALQRATEAAERLGCRHCCLTLDTIAAEILADTEAPERVARYIAAAREYGGAYGRQQSVIAADRAQAVLDLRADQPGDAVRRLESALEDARRLGQPYEVAQTTALLARAYLARSSDGDERRGRAGLDDALAIFSRLGAEPDASRVRAMLEQPLPA